LSEPASRASLQLPVELLDAVLKGIERRWHYIITRCISQRLITPPHPCPTPTPTPPQLILELIKIRTSQGVNARSKATVRKAVADVYAATIDDKVGRRRGLRTEGFRGRRPCEGAAPAVGCGMQSLLAATAARANRSMLLRAARAPLRPQVALKLGRGNWSPNDARIDVGQKEWKLTASGQNVAVWVAVM
jgi:hypothetical protein